MKKRFETVQILTPEHYKELFGQLAESSIATSDEMMRWYSVKGKDIFKKTDWDEYIKKCFQKYDPGTDWDDFESDDIIDAFNSYESEIYQRAIKEWFTSNIDIDNIKFVGMGAYKVVFIDNFGHAFKFGRQFGNTKEEIQIRLKYPHLKCFPILYDYASDFSSYACECAKRIKHNDWKLLSRYGIQNEIQLIHKIRDNSFINMLNKHLNTEQDRALSDLAFYMQYNHLADIGENNIGVANRNGEDVVIIIDYDC